MSDLEISDEEIDIEAAAEDAEANVAALRKTGVIYLSRIPEYMSVKKVRQIFEEYGEVDRIFLQPDGLLMANFVIYMF